MPDAVVQEIAHSVTWWLMAASNSVNRHENILMDMCRRVLNLPLQVSSSITRNGEPLNQSFTEAFNHPVGHVTRTLLNLWFQRKPNDNDRLPGDIEPVFIDLCDVRIGRFRHGRVILASNLIALFRVDRAWTEHHLLPLFDWTVNPTEAKAVWEGFLLSPRLYGPLLIAFKSQFLETARHYNDLGEHTQQFAAFLTYAALGPIDGYTRDEFRAAFEEFPREGLQESAQALAQALEGAGDQREEYWKNRVQPFWQYVWPKSCRLATPRIAESLARLSIASGAKFPEAWDAVRYWLQPLEHPDDVLRRLIESSLCSRFPLEALELLNAVIVDQQWSLSRLEPCLQAIAEAQPCLKENDMYRRLDLHARQYGR
jgi:hypothetical protein